MFAVRCPRLSAAKTGARRGAWAARQCRGDQRELEQREGNSGVARRCTLTVPCRASSYRESGPNPGPSVDPSLVLANVGSGASRASRARSGPSVGPLLWVGPVACALGRMAGGLVGTTAPASPSQRIESGRTGSQHGAPLARAAAPRAEGRGLLDTHSSDGLCAVGTWHLASGTWAPVAPLPGHLPVAPLRSACSSSACTRHACEGARTAGTWAGRLGRA